MKIGALLTAAALSAALLTGCSSDRKVGTKYTDKDYGFQLEKPGADETIAIMHTNMGDISIRLFPEAAPKAVENFTTHAKNGYYDGLTFHRIMEDFMIQGGDPDGNGTGGKSIYETGAFEDEFDEKLMNLRGALAMANSGPNTNGSQFFINQAPASSFAGKAYFEKSADEFKASYKENKKLLQQQYELYKSQLQAQYPTADDYVNAKLVLAPDPKKVPDAVWDLYDKNGGNIHLDGAWRKFGGHTVFGQVFEGMDVVDSIAGVKVDKNGKPDESVVINSIEITTYKG